MPVLASEPSLAEADEALVGGQPLIALAASHQSGDHDHSPAWLRLRSRAYLDLGAPQLAAWQLRGALALEEAGAQPSEAKDNEAQALLQMLLDAPGHDPLSESGPLEGYGGKLEADRWAKRARSHWHAGACRATVAAASEWARFQPEQHEAHRLLGDALRCIGAPRSALDAYRQVAVLEQAELSLQLTIDALKKGLASLEVTIRTPGEGSPAKVRLAYPGGVLSLPSVEPGTVRISGLPWGQPLLLEVSGEDYPLEGHPIAPIALGATRELDVQLVPVGRGRLRLSQAVPGTLVRAREGAGWAVITSEQELSVLAGPIELQVVGSGGVSRLDIDVPEGDLVLVDPTPWLPASIRLEGLPAGARVRLFVEGTEDAIAERSLFIPPGVGRLDPSSGVVLAEPIVVRDLVAGAAGVFVEHLVLGETASVATLRPGTSNVIEYPWRSMAGVPQTTQRYRRWLDERAALKKTIQRRHRASIAATVVTGLASGLLFGAAVAAGDKLEDARSRGIAAGSSGDQIALAYARDDSIGWQRAQQAFLIGSGLSAAGVGFGVGLSFRFAGVGQTQISEFGNWSSNASANTSANESSD